MLLRTMFREYVAHISHREGCEHHPIMVGHESGEGMRVRLKGEKSLVKPCHFTVCAIHEGRCERNEKGQCLIGVVHKGWAHCVPEDHFTKAKGRKIAFARALQGFMLTERAELWRAYLSQVREGKKIKPEKLYLAEEKAWKRAHRGQLHA